MTRRCDAASRHASAGASFGASFGALVVASTVACLLGAATAEAQMAAADEAPYRVAAASPFRAGGRAAAPTDAPSEARSNTAAQARIVALESLGRAQPLEAAAQIERLLAATPALSEQRLELLTVQGLMLAIASRADDAGRVVAQLDAWARTPGAPNAAAAGAAASLVHARSLAQGSDLKRAEAMLQGAIERLPMGDAPRGRYRFVYAQAFVKKELNLMEDAVRLSLEALALADADAAIDADVWRQAEARASLAYVYSVARQPERARALADEAIRVAGGADDWVGLGRAHSIASIVFDLPGEEERQGRESELALNFARRAGAKIDEVKYLANLADYYLKKADYKTALAQAEAALVLAHELGDLSSQTVALANIGLAQIAMHRIQLGRRYVQQAMAIDERRGSPRGVSAILYELGIYLERAGDLAGAVSAYHQYRAMASELLRDDQQRAILALQERHDDERRNRALALLTRENEIKAEQLRRRDLEQWLWRLLALAFVLSFAVVALLYRRMRRTNRLLSSSNEMLKVQSELDPLTGLANRRHFRAAMRSLAADGKLTGTVYLIDIDHFKHINDRHGHGVGDAVLVEVAARLRETLREQDLIVRWGGEEFLVVVQTAGAVQTAAAVQTTDAMPTAGAEQVDALAQRMLGVLDRAPVVCGTQRVRVTASIGFATFPIGPAQLRVSWERAIDLVDTAMYLAKAHGRNRAYGVRVLQAHDEAALGAITQSLEAAWRAGQVALTLLEGRDALAVAA